MTEINCSYHEEHFVAQWAIFSIKMKSLKFRFVRCAVAAVASCGLLYLTETRAMESRGALAQTASGQAGSVELEEMLFVQAPEKGIPKDGIVLGWLPEPLEQLWLGKTA